MTFGRHGLDGDGAPLISAINDPDTANARWNGNDEQTFYAEGWAAPSVVHHEFGHGVVHYLVELEREPENRALNEAIADIFSMNVTGRARSATTFPITSGTITSGTSPSGCRPTPGCWDIPTTPRRTRTAKASITATARSSAMPAICRARRSVAVRANRSCSGP